MSLFKREERKERPQEGVFHTTLTMEELENKIRVTVGKQTIVLADNKSNEKLIDALYETKEDVEYWVRLKSTGNYISIDEISEEKLKKTQKKEKAPRRVRAK